MDWIFAGVLGYALGSIPFGLILTRIFGAGDLRSIGSGNIGATNVLRTGRKGLAAATLLLDAGKGFLAVWLAGHWSESYAGLDAIAGLGALLGHCFPIWLRFRGGKGVATMLGISFALDWRIGFVSAIVWLAAAILTRRSSVGGICSALVAPVTAYVYFMLDEANLFNLGRIFVLLAYSGALAVMALIVIFQHRANIARLLAGTEPKIGNNG